MVRFERVSFRYPSGHDVFYDVDFELPVGSFHFLTGPSGSGKSSLLRLMYLAALPSSGRVQLFNKDVRSINHDEMPKIRRRIGVVFQDFRLLEHLSILDNVALVLKVAGTYSPEVKHHVAELLRWVGLGDKIHALPSSLSGGEKQRVAIARAVIGKPKLLLADEPTGNVDDKIALRLMYLFEELHKMGTTVVVATHNRMLIENFKYPRLHLDQGRLLMGGGMA